MPLHAPILRCALAAALLAAPPGFAADQPAKSAGPAGGAFLSRDELRACMARKTGLAQQGAELVKEQAELATTRAELTRQGDALKEQLAGVDRSDAEAVNAYNDQLRARDQRIDAYQARVEAYNSRVQATQTERAGHAKDCAQRRYLEDDEIAIKKGR